LPYLSNAYEASLLMQTLRTAALQSHMNEFGGGKMTYEIRIDILTLGDNGTRMRYF
jgi:hypothetical protein